MRIAGLDHLVLTCADLERTVAWYERVLGMRAETFAGGRRALHFGTQKVNLHQAGEEFEPKAARPTPGSADLCFVHDGELEAVVEHLRSVEVAIEEGPVERTGARGGMRSVYVRDPDQNLIEVCSYG